MLGNNLARITNEYQEARTNPVDNIVSVSLPNDQDYCHWEAVILGPKDTPYEGGHFKLDIRVPSEYPMKPPVITFKTRVYHPNISIDGAVCLDMLKENQWSPALTIPKCILMVCAILSRCDAEDPIEPEIAHQYAQDFENYSLIAKLWT